eukprot:220381_1
MIMQHQLFDHAAISLIESDEICSDITPLNIPIKYSKEELSKPNNKSKPFPIYTAPFPFQPNNPPKTSLNCDLNNNIMMEPTKFIFSPEPMINQINLTPNICSDKAWLKYSDILCKQLSLSSSNNIILDAPYCISNLDHTGKLDLILKVSHIFGPKKYTKMYLVHKQYAAEGQHNSKVIQMAIEERKNIIDIDIEVDFDYAYAMDYVIIYMYTGHVIINLQDLIPLFCLVERLKLNGNLINDLLTHIRYQCQTKSGKLIEYLLQSYLVQSNFIRNEIYLQISKKAGKHKCNIVYIEELNYDQFETLFKQSIILCNNKNINKT